MFYKGVDKKSSGLNLINGDRNLNPFEELLYILLGRAEHYFKQDSINGFMPFHLTKEIIVSPSGTASPSRQQCLDFLDCLNHHWLRGKLKDINILDIGCGRGQYSNILANKGYKSYFGIDAQPYNEWEDHNKCNATFKSVECGVDPLPIPENTNFIFSQSSLEHIRYDLKLFHELQSYCAKADHPVLQLHLVPAPQSINAYGAHGWRCYTPKDVNHITNMFSPCGYAVFGLGNHRSRQAYFERYQDNRLVPFLLRNIFRNKKGLKHTICINATDGTCFDQNEADFWAIVILTAPSTKDSYTLSVQDALFKKSSVKNAHPIDRTG